MTVCAFVFAFIVCFMCIFSTVPFCFVFLFFSLGSLNGKGFVFKSLIRADLTFYNTQKEIAKLESGVMCKEEVSFHCYEWDELANTCKPT